MTTGNTTHNGWTNYATWRINLEIFSDCDWADVTADTDPSELVEQLKESLEMYIDESTQSNSLVRGWVDAFIVDVNFYEIAEHIIEGVKEEAESNA